MNLKLQKSSIVNRQSSIVITGSKSESNRLLLLQALFPTLSIQNVSNADDAVLMQKALSSTSTSFSDSTSTSINVHHAGTAMRFLTAFLASQSGRDVTLTGSSRMQERPIKVLVDALVQLGADISYKKNEGYPPLYIKGQEFTKNKVSIKANVSSQYISALLLIAPSLKNGLELVLEGEITSMPYIEMTLGLLNQLGVKTKFQNNMISIECAQHGISPITLTVESDWSSASYYYSIVALSEIGTEITLSSYKENSLQGDSILSDLYKNFGVSTTFKNNSIVLEKKLDNKEPKSFNLVNCPDIAQTIAVTCLGLGINCHLNGLHTLKIKETDRLVALKTEIEKFGTAVSITNDSLTINNIQDLNNNVVVETYKDHRMAMAFSPLGLKTNLTINNAEVVSKSYPDFWKDLSQLGFSLKEN